MIVAYYALSAITALIAIILFQPIESPEAMRNRIAMLAKAFTTRCAHSKAQYFVLLIATMIFYVSTSSTFYLSLFALACFVLTDPWKFVLLVLESRSTSPDALGLGQLAGVQAKNTFLVKLFADRPSVKLFEPIEFQMKFDQLKTLRRGIILDNYVLNEEQWVKVYADPDISCELTEIPAIQNKVDNVVYKIVNGSTPSFLQNLVGFVAEHSTIGRIKFIYNSRIEITEGTLLQSKISGATVLYQIVQGTVQVETLEGQNETGFIVGEAVQLGVWNNVKGMFMKFGWLPEINCPLFLASDIVAPTLEPGETLIGRIPNTNYPVIMNKPDSITHHMAILGVTGTGKSVFARNLIREHAADGVKVICVDFTGEYRARFADLDPTNVVSPQSSTQIFRQIEIYHDELAKFANIQNRSVINNADRAIRDYFAADIASFLKDETKNLTLLELPDVGNTSGVFEFTKAFFRVLFETAKMHNSYGKRICVVLEEAHTIIPEWNFAGTHDKTSQSLVNSIAQIALQGRKYNVGFLVIAQRTANVSKTILTQCNSIIAFQEFDKTSTEFLSNYMGPEVAGSLPNLKARQAVAVGKAFRSNVPMIFEVPQINEVAAPVILQTPPTAAVP